jgi:hypothetical protein
MGFSLNVCMNEYIQNKAALSKFLRITEAHIRLVAPTGFRRLDETLENKRSSRYILVSLQSKVGQFSV